MSPRRGEELRTHILWTAKDVFLEAGFERTSMDVVAQRAATSKRSLYAKYPSKDALFAGVVGLARGLYLEQLGAPADYAVDEDAAETLVQYFGRMLQLLLWSSSLRTLRLGIAESERVPDLASGYYAGVVETPTTDVAAFIATQWHLESGSAQDRAERLFALSIYPELTRALFGVRPPFIERPEKAELAADIDLDGLRRLVHTLLPEPAS